MPGGDASSTPGVRRALLIAVKRVKGFIDLEMAHKDVLRLRTLLIKYRHYRPENIVLMMHDWSVDGNFYPSRKNILREIDLIVKHTSQHDRIFFYYVGNGDQVTCKHNAEPDSKDEAILTYTGKRIIGKVLKERLVNPLPRGAKLFALWDCGYSHTLLDPEHDHCNTLQESSKVLSGLARKTNSLGKRSSTSLLRDSSQSPSSTKDESQARSRSSTIDNILPDLRRVASPDSYLHICTPNCPMTLPEKQVKAHVVSLSACKDNDSLYGDNIKGDTVTKFFIEHLECNPKASYQDLLFDIQQGVDALTHRWKLAQNPTTDEVESENRHKCELHDHATHDDNDASNLYSQRPLYSSHYRLDISQVIDL